MTEQRCDTCLHWRHVMDGVGVCDHPTSLEPGTFTLDHESCTHHQESHP